MFDHLLSWLLAQRCVLGCGARVPADGLTHHLHLRHAELH